jgi:pepF/M3 family oligoendopeptidase
METQTFPLKWDLERFFKDKGTKEDFTVFISSIQKELLHLEDALKKETSPLIESILLSQKIEEHLSEALSFVTCLLAEDTHNTEALSYQTTLNTQRATLDNCFTLLDEYLLHLKDKDFNALIENPLCKKIAFCLQERKTLAKDKLSPALEALITNLSIDGYHGYSQLFYTLHGKLKFPLKDQILSIGQIDNALSSPDRNTREDAFQVYKQVFKDHEAPFAQVLNYLAGFRLQVYKERSWDALLKEPLFANRMEPSTLHAMWQAINEGITPFVHYLQRKAALLGLKNLSWHDIDAPLNASQTMISYEEACHFILRHFKTYSSRMTQFSKKALEDGWIEAENRPNKSAGGFCIGFPLKKESRIFMTYSGTQNNIATLAHELGHAYHNEVIFPHPYFAQNIKMNVAETASTMAEMIVCDAALEEASSKEEKLSLLDDKVSRSVAFFMNIQARFLFEKAFYEERKHGYVTPERLCLLMKQAQEKAFHHTLSEWHPHFWASKMHFYFTDVPFYNFPYTFGYLFSLGIYTLLKEDKSSFERRYDALLYDTPLMSSEALAKKHLNMDITQTTFWEKAVKEAARSAAMFLEMTDA